MAAEEQPLGTWQTADDATYAVVVSKLIALAQEASTPELKLQYGQLAALYERLAKYATKLTHRATPARNRAPKGSTIH
jgi:hypothetical protein